MTEFAGIMEDCWDLQAIVRGCTSEFASAIMEDSYNNSQSCSFLPFDSIIDQQQDHHDELLYGFSDCFQKNTSVLDELDELYKPFYPPQASMTMHVPNEVLLKEPPPPPPPQHDVQNQQPLPGLSTVVDATNIISATIPKRRKNQHKRVVKQVTVDDLSSDTWAWRKYGQKPIKGSPYPRSYYRCSSSKGCLARKQVERNGLDPTMFIITYTAEHSHSHPVRRNSLAGIAKKKSSSSTMKNPITSDDPETPPPSTTIMKDSSCCSPMSSTTTTTVLSPTSPLMACLEDEFPQHESKRERMKEEEEEQMIIKDSSSSMMSNSVLFSGLEGGLDNGLTSDIAAFECWFPDQIPSTFQS